MPFKNYEEKLAYQRKWYAAHKERVIKKVSERKWGMYGGTCRNCGRPTIGETKGKTSEFCGRPECKSAQHKENREMFVEAGRKPHLSAKRKLRRKLREKNVVTIDELTKLMD